MLKADFHIVPKLFNKVSDYAKEHHYYWSNDKQFLLMKYLARFIAVRQRVSQPHLLAHETLQQALSESSIRVPDRIDKIIATLDQEGYYQGLRLPEKLTEDFLQYAFSHPCYANRDPSQTPLYLRPDIIQSCPEMSFRVANYVRDQDSCPLIQQLIKDPLLLAIAEAYLGCTPVHHKSELLWSFPHKQSSDYCYTHFFHCDINDYRNIKFFFYLTDVDETSGPHLYIKSSHKNRSWLAQLQGGPPSPFADQRLTRHYGEEQIQVVTGPAGFGFVGDPYSFHRGSDTHGKARLLLQVEYTISTYRCWYYGR